ncbi:glyoxalase-like domain-containing protein [Panaeolus papilionaceus]|nr:glyoxalase-like domain-containing protein [Panaeolus papilionaceus]
MQTGETNTHILDHLVHLTPPGTVAQTTRQFSDLGFRVIPGGVHAGGLTENALVILADGVYLELISFTHPISHYPVNSPERRLRESHAWASKRPGWIDFAFLGTGSRSNSVSATINQRANIAGNGLVYDAEVDGGRTRQDGQVLKWLISSPPSSSRGALPFFCGDVTPRTLRVPFEPVSNVQHPCTAKGVAYVKILTSLVDFERKKSWLTSVTGVKPVAASENEATWRVLSNPIQEINRNLEPRLILHVPTSDEERAYLEERGTTGVYEVGFRVTRGSKAGVELTPFGRVSWIVEERLDL